MNRPDPFMADTARLRRALACASPQPSSDFDLAPSLRASLPKGRKLRAAAVLVAVQPGPHGAQILLTRRAPGMRHHPGQVAFPGGKVDAGDATPLAAALRESHEEIGLPPDTVEVLGAMPSHETVTGFEVVPFIGLIPAGFAPVPEAGEVDEVFAVPLRFLMDPANHARQARVWQGVNRPYLTMPYGPHYIWGATARMLQALSVAWARAQ
ncbi:CoA pyrophosphatase [Abyssibius alkaniclasticus]|uniref:CoA pyrophosphatase n=1 Tax=Abyssibius alkaniclasticus TaxID=2881234 RepID=UPI0023641214|nr:CoA pyrophosphatase [Abyssibius alkaniclasticus]UPH71706.1 CoA pyrophosphatase [Abyssibius alkaniclasticus]